MSEPEESPSNLTSSILRQIAWGEKHGLLENRFNRAAFRAVRLGVADPWMEAMLLEGVQELRVKEISGELEPFREPQLDDGELVLGTSSLGRPIRVPLQTASSGFLLVMPTGEGKSSFLRFCLPKLATENDVPVWIFEQAKPEGRHLAPFFPPGDKGLVVHRPQDSKYEPMHPGDSDLRRHLSNFSNVLARGLGLGDRSHAVIYQICDYLYGKFGNWEGNREAFPSLFDVYSLVRYTPGILPAVKESILDRMTPMLLEMNAWRLGHSPSDLARHSICFEMGGAPESLKHVISESLIFSVFQAEIEKGAVNSPLKLFVAFDDAQAFAQQDLGGQMTSLDVAAGTVRGAGIGICICAQTMEGLSRKLIPNLTGLRIMGRPGSNFDAQQLGSDMGLDREQVEWAKRHLEPGTYVAKTNQWPEPFVLHVPFVPTQRPVSDEEAEQSLGILDHLKTVPAEEYANWTPNHIIRVPHAAEKREDGKAPSARTGEGSRNRVSKEELDYLESVAVSPFLGATQRDTRLGLSPSKGNRIRAKLLKKCLVQAVAINPGGGRGRRFTLLDLTENGRHFLKSYGINSPPGRGRGGVEHQWWAWKISEWLNAKGIPSTIEDESLGARVDIAVETERGMVAVEVEISRGHEVENILKDLGAGFEEVVCLVGSAELAQTVEERVVRELNQSEISRVRIGCLREYQELLEGLVS